MIAQIQMRRGTTAEWAAANPVVLAAGEPGYDSTLKGMKIGDGATEWASLPWADAINNSDIDADKLDGSHLADIRLGQNILHNCDFRNPINQRGVSGAIGGGTYFFDRWIRNSGTVTVAAGYLTLASGAVVEQRIEGLYLAGETVTVSVQTDAEIISGTGVFPTAAGTESITLAGFGTATLGYNAGYMFVRFAADAARNLVRVKGELGTISTLHLDPPMDHAVELAKCRRYYRQESGDIQHMTTSLRAHSVDSMFGAIQFSTPMRITPTLGIVAVRSNDYGVLGYVASFASQHNSNGINAIYNIVFSPAYTVTPGVYYTFYIIADSEL